MDLKICIGLDSGCRFSCPCTGDVTATGDEIKLPSSTIRTQWKVNELLMCNLKQSLTRRQSWKTEQIAFFRMLLWNHSICWKALLLFTISLICQCTEYFTILGNQRLKMHTWNCSSGKQNKRILIRNSSNLTNVPDTRFEDWAVSARNSYMIRWKSCLRKWSKREIRKTTSVILSSSNPVCWLWLEL